MNRFEKTEILVDEVYLEKGDIVVVSRHKGISITLRRFQEELVRVLGTEDGARYIGVEAPTGGGKTFTTLAPLISNMLFGTRYSGVAGIYPTKPLVNDQFISIRDMLDKLGEKVYEVRGKDGFEVAIKYSLELEVVDGKSSTKEIGSVTVGLIRLTKESLDKLQESIENIPGRLSLLELIRKTFLDADYLIVVAVPEYPYLMLSSLYRSVPDAQKLLSLVAEEGFVYNLAKKIALSTLEEAVETVRSLRNELTQLLQPKSIERERLNIYSALFSEVMFLDEFHTWTVYERPTILALVLLHYLESQRTSASERYKVIFSSATPQNEFYDMLKKLGLGEVRKIIASPADTPSNAHRVKSKALVKFVPCSTKAVSGVVSWFKVEECISNLVEEFADEIKSRGRAIIFGRRNAVVEEAAEVFYNATGEEPAVVTGVKTRFPGKELLEQRKESGKLFVFGNYSIELGIDLRRIPFGIVYGVCVGEVIQRLGRIGRGDVDQAEIVIPIPCEYKSTVTRFVEKHGSKMSYEKFIELLGEIMPRVLGIESYGTKFITRHNLGRLRIYLPLATYILTLVVLWEYTEELRKLCQRFTEIVEALDIPIIFYWLKKVSKSAEVLIPVASFRITTSVPYVRDGVEDYASLSTLLGNYDVEYANGKLTIKGVFRKSLQDVLSLKCKYLPKGLFDTVLPSSLLLTLTENNLSGDTVLYKILKNYPIPVYVAPFREDYEVFNAFGYAIRVELIMEDRSFYLIIL